MVSVTRKQFRRVVRIGAPLGVLLLCLWELSRRFEGLSFAGAAQDLADIPLLPWLAAAIATAGSFWAVGRYDRVAHRHLGTHIPPKDAQISGAASIALAQTIGFGLATGAVARWRMLPGLSPVKALQVSAFVSCTFMLGWAAVTAVCLAAFSAPGWAKMIGIAGVAFLPVVLAGLFWLPDPRAFGKSWSLPSLRACGAIAGWAFVDLSLAALALYVLIPGQDPAGFFAFLPIFLLAIGAALLSGTPGGVGPFELVLIGLLPTVPPQEVLCGIVAFRVIYYAIPALAGCAVLILPRRDAVRTSDAPIAFSPPDRRAETAVISQNGGQWQHVAQATCAMWPTRQTLTCVFDPVGALTVTTFAHLAQMAEDQNRSPLLYKIRPKAALAARQAGWTVLHTADEALVDLSTYSLDTRPRRTLRRKLRNAEKLSVTTTCPQRLPLLEMIEIDAQWQAHRGKARGGTMGRFCPDYLATQHVVTASVGGKLCAFASFHVTEHEWALDLMRTTSDAPDGTMHLLVHNAICRAKAAGARHMSLAAVTACPDPTRKIHRRLARLAAQQAGGAGLRQFKSNFAPQWHPVYIAAPTFAALLIGAFDILRAVVRPDPIHQADTRNSHNDDENYRIAPRTGT